MRSRGGVGIVRIGGCRIRRVPRQHDLGEVGRRHTHLRSCGRDEAARGHRAQPAHQSLLGGRRARPALHGGQAVGQDILGQILGGMPRRAGGALEHGVADRDEDRPRRDVEGADSGSVSAGKRAAVTAASSAASEGDGVDMLVSIQTGAAPVVAAASPWGDARVSSAVVGGLRQGCRRSERQVQTSAMSYRCALFNLSRRFC